MQHEEGAALGMQRQARRFTIFWQVEIEGLRESSQLALLAFQVAWVGILVEYDSMFVESTCHSGLVVGSGPAGRAISQLIILNATALRPRPPPRSKIPSHKYFTNALGIRSSCH